MKKYGKEKLVASPYEVARTASVAMINLQMELFNAGFHTTAAAVNLASKKLGWEAARLIERSTKKM